MSSFALLGVPEPLCHALARRGIDEPFPIQAATVPDALAGRDVAGKAPTGSGKTLAFGLAVAARALDGTRPKPRRPRALVLVPTRELAAQVQRELAHLVPCDAGPVTAIYGGVGYGPQRSALVSGANTIVACPGRLEDLMATGDVVLDRVEVAVVDEADRMADMGFLPAVKRILDTTPDRRQTLLFSATLDGDVDALVRRYQRDPVRHEVAGHDDGGDVRHMFWRVPRAQRSAVAAQVVDRSGPTIVFCKTTHGADRVARQLAKEGVPAVAIHGRRSQAQRTRALASFTRGQTPALVATDVAARGIHVDGVAAVVHFDLPEDAKDFVHRSGRTGRAGADGLVVSLVAVEDGDRKARQLQNAVGLQEPIDAPDYALVDEAAVAAAATAATAVAAVAARRASAPTPVSTMAAAATVSLAGADPVEADEYAPQGAGARRRSRARRERLETGDRRERAPRQRGDRTRSERDGRRRRNAEAVPVADAPSSTGRSNGSAQGTVKSFHAAKGYGFITRPNGADVFVHASNTGGRHLAPGERVRFEVAPGRKGHQALNVRPA